ncbi:MAG: hypothetical protein ACFB15_16055 [Cyclobacteriaceae bacterium]
MTTQNAKLRAIVSIRNLVFGIATDWKELKSLGSEIDELINSASTTFMNQTPVIAHERWQIEIGHIQKDTTALEDIMQKVVSKSYHRDAKDLIEIWNSHKEHSTDLLNRLNTLYDLGKAHLPESYHDTWVAMWEVILDKFVAIQALGEGSSLHLAMISEYAPEEVDELTDTILRHMPGRYTMEEAIQYEKEYMEAYEQLKKEATQKKNLWDRFLDILAGGLQQSPAERVMMQRWVNGEKGDL